MCAWTRVRKLTFEDYFLFITFHTCKLFFFLEMTYVRRCHYILVRQTTKVVGYTLCWLFNSFFSIQIFSCKMVVVVDDLSGQATAQVGFLRTCANYSRSLSDNRLLFAALMCNLFYCVLPCPPVDWSRVRFFPRNPRWQYQYTLYGDDWSVLPTAWTDPPGPHDRLPS